MRFKLDENFGTRTQRIFKSTGHDVQTVREESLQGASDQHLYEVCCTEQLCLVTLDLDFANVTHFPPEETGGIAVIRVPRNPSLSLLERLVRQFLQSVDQMPVEKKLWIVEVGRLRVHQTDGSDEP
jgi:predicted nuclease of predicted toxin-antitoxin system